MQKRTIERNMFYNASPALFEKAKLLRLNMTREEEILWKRLKKSQLGYRFKSQHPIENFIVDFYCHKAKLVIEVDGMSHQKQIEYDNGRTAEIEKYGIKVIRFTNEEILNNIEKVIESISLYLSLLTPKGGHVYHSCNGKISKYHLHEKVYPISILLHFPSLLLSTHTNHLPVWNR